MGKRPNCASQPGSNGVPGFGVFAVLIGLKKKTKVDTMIVSVHAAKTQLSKLLDLLDEGEDVVIVRHGHPVARLVRANSSTKPQLGAMRGEISWEEGWERAMTAEEADAFWNGRSTPERGSGGRSAPCGALRLSVVTSANGLALITSDKQFGQYQIKLVW